MKDLVTRSEGKTYTQMRSVKMELGEMLWTGLMRFMIRTSHKLL
jgi:hypothetical protein